jgi:uroporphyrin-III C-methyltransferase/precorrin-2 dehydrogenase/sirohydrochlorin ferrochelatase
MKMVVPENPESSDAPRLFPAFLKLSGRAVALIGGGRVAAAKLPALDGVWFVVAAAPAEVNRRVAVAAEARGIFVNAVDDPASGSAYTGGVLRRFGATIAISTEGRAPALAGLLREGLEYVIPEDLGRWLAEARSVRQQQRAEGVPMSRRRPLLLAALNRLYAEKGSRT